MLFKIWLLKILLTQMMSEMKNWVVKKSLYSNAAKSQKKYKK